MSGVEAGRCSVLCPDVGWVFLMIMQRVTSKIERNRVKEDTGRCQAGLTYCAELLTCS